MPRSGKRQFLGSKSNGPSLARARPRFRTPNTDVNAALENPLTGSAAAASSLAKPQVDVDDASGFVAYRTPDARCSKVSAERQSRWEDEDGNKRG
ncbi:hypothetical protein EVG20_g1459 [Dentipellis fragilis]|uniref:Uncharacterized protein n=1 Tax=Dentipellis fragilis TaxID=205917 RepID=A0A4Y9ZAF8_9AGAM|nr:hypothetical protein EVG20_g1459 [Dentipellis fragilis]